MNSLANSRIVFGCALGVLAACSQGTPGSSGSAGALVPVAAVASRGGQWIANGAAACDKYLTPDVIAAILVHPAGHIEKRGEQACAYVTDYGGDISIMLVNGGPSVFDAHQAYLVHPVSVPGIGDRASRSVKGIEAVKGADRMCSIDDGTVAGYTKLKDEALAQKLGEICNKLFALP